MGGEPVAERVQAQWRRILEHLTRPEEPDAELLRRFIEQRDAEAFAEIVRRYEGLVWSLCRHRLGCEADADDAFQATFLALIRSAKKIRGKDHLGPWLHGVAYRVCQNARRAAAKRARREQAVLVAEASQPVADTAWDETLAAVHEQVNQLPETLRVPFVLCYLQGKSTSAAATELGLKLGTFSSRLSRAKKAVLDALAKRGCTAIAVAASMTGVAASAPPGLANRVVHLALSKGTIPANLLALTQGVTHMGVSKFKYLAAALVLGISLLAGSFGIWSAKAQGPGAGAPGGFPGGGGGPAAPGPGGLGGPSTGSAASAGMPGGRGISRANPFEYKIIDLIGRGEMAERELNRLGEDGWELVNVTATSTGAGRESKTAYLKRRKLGSPTGWMGGMGGGGSSSAFPGRPGFGGAGGGAGLPGTGGAGNGGAPTKPGGGGLGGAPATDAGLATPGATGGDANDPTKNLNLVRSIATVESVSNSFIATEQGALYAINSNTLLIARGKPGKLTDLKPGSKVQIYWDKEAKVTSAVVIQ